MKPTLCLLLLAGCSGEADVQCPSVFAMETAPDTGGCLNPQPQLAFLATVGIDIDPGSVRLTVMDVELWHVAGQPESMDASGYTTDSDVYVDYDGHSLTHELLHVHERPRISNHQAWSDNGYYALCNLETFVDRNDMTAYGFRVNPCRPPTLPDDMATRLRAAGYPVDTFLASAEASCDGIP